MNDKKTEYLIEGISKDIIAYLMEDNGMKMTEAISVFHYIESSAYVYEILKSELKMGKITQE